MLSLICRFYSLISSEETQMCPLGRESCTPRTLLFSKHRNSVSFKRQNPRVNVAMANRPRDATDVTPVKGLRARKGRGCRRDHFHQLTASQVEPVLHLLPRASERSGSVWRTAA